jgi:hypothetical protein
MVGVIDGVIVGGNVGVDVGVCVLINVLDGSGISVRVDNTSGVIVSYGDGFANEQNSRYRV